MKNDFENRYWSIADKKADNGNPVYELHFTEFYDDEIIATFYQDDEDSSTYLMSSETLRQDETIFTASSIDDMKEQVAEFVIEMWNDEIKCLQERIEKFNE